MALDGNGETFSNHLTPQEQQKIINSAQDQFVRPYQTDPDQNPGGPKDWFDVVAISPWFPNGNLERSPWYDRSDPAERYPKNYKEIGWKVVGDPTKHHRIWL